MTDNHVHVGWYSDGYHYPLDVWQAEQNAGIGDIVVSSTSTCAELYKLVVREMHELIKVGGSHVHPLLWVTPRMMKTWGIRYMLHSKIRWQGVKMHWGAHQEWYYNRRLVREVLKIAHIKHLSVLLHTGGAKECEAGVFKEICKDNPDMTFILAHGRPIEQTIDILSDSPNSYVDTAFMPVNDVLSLVEKGLSDRVVFGTDVPINLLYYKGKTMTEYIKDCLWQLKKMLPKEDYNKIINKQIYK